MPVFARMSLERLVMFLYFSLQTVACAIAALVILWIWWTTDNEVDAAIALRLFWAFVVVTVILGFIARRIKR